MPSSQRLADEHLDVVADALVRVVGRIALKLHAVVVGIMQPFAEIFARHPAAPADLEPLVEIELIDRQHGEDCGEHTEHDELADEAVPVVVLQRVVETTAPLVQQHIVGDQRQLDRDDRGKQAAAGPFVFGVEIRRCNAPDRRERRTNVVHRLPSPGDRLQRLEKTGQSGNLQTKVVGSSVSVHLSQHDG